MTVFPQNKVTYSNLFAMHRQIHAKNKIGLQFFHQFFFNSVFVFVNWDRAIHARRIAEYLNSYPISISSPVIHVLWMKQISNFISSWHGNTTDLNCSIVLLKRSASQFSMPNTLTSNVAVGDKSKTLCRFHFILMKNFMKLQQMLYTKQSFTKVFGKTLQQWWSSTVTYTNDVDAIIWNV